MHFRQQILGALALAGALCAASSADARLTRFEVTQRDVVAGGEAFGATGPYVAKVEQAARALEKRRLMLPDDVELTVHEASESDVLR